MQDEHLAAAGDRADHTAGSIAEYRSNATLLGETAWLMLRANARREWHIWDFARFVMPAIGRQQFRLYYNATVPIAYVSWAFLSPESEGRFIADPKALRPEDWASGDRAYIVDLVAPQGALAKIASLLRRDPLLRAHRISAFKRRNGQLKMIELSPGLRGRPRITVRSVLPDRPAVSGDSETTCSTPSANSAVTAACSE
jgi:cytolysin-activating lysine-acyltransferase